MTPPSSPPSQNPSTRTCLMNVSLGGRAAPAPIPIGSSDLTAQPSPTMPSFRTEQADFLFRVRSCECAGLRREKSLFSFLSPANRESRLLVEVTCEVKSSPECGYSNGGNGGWAL